MKSDSYSRYLRSDMYKDFLNGSKKKVGAIFTNVLLFIEYNYFQTSVKGIRSIVSFPGRKDNLT